MFILRNPAPMSVWHEIYHNEHDFRTKNEKREPASRNPEALLAAPEERS
jgi:hypothetical protein